MDAEQPGDAPGADLVDLWLGCITALVIAGAGVTVGMLALFAPGELRPWAPLALGVGLALLVATPLAAAWGTRRADWQGAGLRAVGVGLLGAAVAVPLVHGVAGAAGLTVSVSAVLLAATGGIGASVAAAARVTSRWSLPARGAAVAGVLLGPLAVIAAGEMLGPTPSAVAQSMWTAAPLVVIPVVGAADSLGFALAARRRRER